MKDVDFVGGCNGNLQGISSLVKGMKVEDAIEKTCRNQMRFQSNFLPDQLAKALRESNRSVN
ncbi:MAG: TSCPD domain-containing protein [Dorea sp.]